MKDEELRNSKWLKSAFWERLLEKKELVFIIFYVIIMVKIDILVTK